MISTDVAWCIIHMHFDLDMEAKEIANLLWTPKHDISGRSVARIIKRFEECGTVRAPRAHCALSSLLVPAEPVDPRAAGGAFIVSVQSQARSFAARARGGPPRDHHSRSIPLPG